MPTFELSRPFNWCDYRCERCPLNQECPTPARSHISLEDSLREAVELAEQALRDRGIDPDSVGDPPPPSLDEQVSGKVAMDWMMAWERVNPGDPRASLVCMKVARVFNEVRDDDDGGVFVMDTAPNLILIERMLADVRADAERARSAHRAEIERFDILDALLRSVLAPLFGRLTVSDRSVIAILAAAGRAPSPFAVIGQ